MEIKLYMCKLHSECILPFFGCLIDPCCQEELNNINAGQNNCQFMNDITL